jgi:SAM-dependent methyltransferase
VPVMSAVEGTFCRSAPWRGFARRVVLPWALQDVPLPGEVLELGCGSGAMAEGLARSHPSARLTATDLDPAMVAVARRRLRALPQVRLEAVDATELPYPDASFDVVTSFLMLHHVVEWRAALEEVARILKPGGTLVGYDLDDTWLARTVHVVDRSPHRLVDADELARALGDAGFTQVSVRRALGGQAHRFRASTS